MDKLFSLLREYSGRGNVKMLKIICDEAIRLLALTYGAHGISKGEVLDVLKSKVKGDIGELALKFWRRYVEGESLTVDEEHELPGVIVKILEHVALTLKCKSG